MDIASLFRGWRSLAIPVLLAALASPGARAACVLEPGSGSPGSPLTVEAGSLQFVTIAATNTGVPECSEAEYQIEEVSDTTDDSYLKGADSGSVAATGVPIQVPVQISFRGGGSVTYRVLCTSGCDVAGAEQFQQTFVVEDNYHFRREPTPPMAQSGGTVLLRAVLERNGSGAALEPAERDICFDFTGKVRVGASLSGGSGPCGSFGRLAQADANGLAAVTLNVGADAHPFGETIEVRATAVAVQSVPPLDYNILVSDTLTIELASGGGQVVAPGANFEPVTILTRRNGVPAPLALEFIPPVNASYSPQPPDGTTTGPDGRLTVQLVAGPTVGQAEIGICIEDTGCDLASTFTFTISTDASLVLAAPEQPRYYVGEPYEFAVRAFNGGSPVDGATIWFDSGECSFGDVSFSATMAVTSGGGRASTLVTPNSVGQHCAQARWDVDNTPLDPSDDIAVAIEMFAEDNYLIEAVTSLPLTVAPGQTAGITMRLRRNGSPVDDDPYVSLIVSQISGPPLPGLPSFSNIQNAPGEYTVSVPIPESGTYVLDATFDTVLPGRKAASGSLPVNLVFTVNGGTTGGGLTANPDDFSSTPVNGFTGGATPSVLSNDDYYGSVPDPAFVTLTLTSDGGTGASFTAGGQIQVPAGTAAGTYSLAYEFCDVAQPGICGGPTSVLVAVSAPAVAAVNDDFSATPIGSVTGGTTPSVLANDTINGAQATASFVEVTLDSDGGLSGATMHPDGTIQVPPSSPVGSYPLEYRICDRTNPSNCASATATVVVTAMARTLTKPATGGDGDGQVAAPGETLPLQLVAVAADNGAVPATVVNVNWTVLPSGMATVTPNPSPIDSAGVVRVSVTISPSAPPGQEITIVASRADEPAATTTFYANVSGGSIDLIKPETGSGDGQTGSQGQLAAQPLVVVATMDGAPQAGVVINWAVDSGDATLVNIINPTNSLGRSSAQVQFGPNATSVTVSARRADESDLVEFFTLTATPRRTLEKPATGSGDRQTGEPGETLPLPLVVYAYDNGTPTPDVLVTWTASSGVTLSDTSTATGADGSTSVNVTLGNATGDFLITAQRSDAPSATSSFVVRAMPRGQATLSLVKPANSGDGSSGPAGAQIELLALARANLQPQPDVRVLWEVLSGSATVRASSFSGLDGIARNTVTLGSTPGEVVVRASRQDSPENFQDYTLTVQPGADDLVLDAIAGNGQSGAPRAALDPLAVRLSRGGQPVAGASIEWQVVSGAAQLSTALTVTGSDGTSEVGVTLGEALGPVVVRARSGNASASFTLEVVQFDPGELSLRALSGNSQFGAVGSRATLPLVVAAQDGNDRPARGVALEWQVISGSATLDSAQTTTDAAGQSSVGLQFGSSAGPVQVRVRPVGETTPSVVFNATAFVPTLQIVSGNNQEGTPGTPLAEDFVVAVSGAPAGASLAGITVHWEVAQGGGTLASATTVTDADGRSGNRLTLGSNAGANRVTATVEGAGNVSFSANGLSAGQPLTIISGNNQILPTRSDSAPLVVELRNGAGTPVPGARLVWSASNGELRSAETTTDAQGRSSNVVQVVMPGEATVTVALEGATGGASQAVFTLTGGVANVPQLDQEEEDVGNAIDHACPALAGAGGNLTPEQADLLARCLELVNNAGANPDQVEDALVQMQQDVAVAQANAALMSASAQFDNIKTRLAALRAGAKGVDLNGLAIANTSGVMPLSFLPSAIVQAESEGEGGGASDLGSDFSRWGFFASGIIGRGEQDGRSATPEYSYDTTGVTAGVDFRVNDEWVVGASVGWNRQDTDVAGGRGGIDTRGWSVSAYSTWYRPSNWYMDGVLTVGSNDYDIERSIQYEIAGADGGTTRVDQLARASTGGDQLALALSFGRDFQKGAWTLGPYLRGNYTRVEFDRYTETLRSGIGSGLGLEVESRELKSITAVVGGKATYAISRDWGILMPHMQFEWEHEFQDDPQALVTRFVNDPTRTAIRIEGDAIDTDYFNVGFGLSALFPRGRSAFLYYERLVGSEGLTQDNLSLGVRIEF